MAGKNLEKTPTYRVAFIVFVFVAVSLVFEKSLHHLALYLKKRKKKGLYHATETLKEELMLLGFISLLLTIFQDDISGWCVPTAGSSAWLPCRESEIIKTPPAAAHGDAAAAAATAASAGNGAGQRRLLASKEGRCGPREEPFMSYDAMHYVHYFIFILAIMMVVYASLAFLLSFLRIRGWRAWEEKAQSPEYVRDAQAAGTTEEKMRFAGLRDRKAVVYAIENDECCRAPRFWLASFLLQFVRSLQEGDYLTLRMLFITNHNLSLHFDFHEYLTRCMEEDFANVVGISIPMWLMLVFLLIFNMRRNGLFFWFELVGVALCISVGMKLIAILRTLSAESSTGTGLFVASDPKPTDKLFWFGKPSLLLVFIHFIFFANSLELSAFVFYTWKFGLDSCLQEKGSIIVVRLVFSFTLLVLSAYVTLPLYALVSQMGSSYRQQILHDPMRHTKSSFRSDGGSKKHHHSPLAAHAAV